MNAPLIEREWQPGDTLESGFLAIPRQIYADDPYWPGEDPVALARQFSAANPFTRHGKIWTGYIRDAARLAGFTALTTAGERVVNFGFWETINALAPNQRLFNALARWAKEQGATRLVGPINFNTLGAFRLRLDTPTCPPFAGEAYNPPWYQHLLEQMGFQTLAKYFSLSDEATVVQQYQMSDDPGRWRYGEVTLQPLTPALWHQHQDALYRLITENFSKNAGWTRCNQALFDWHFNAQSIKPFCDAPGSCLVLDAEGEVVGFLFNHYDARNQTGWFKTIMIVPRYRRTPLYATLVRHFLTCFGQRYPRLGVSLLNWRGPTTRTSLQFCTGPNKVFHHYALFYREVNHELL